MGVDTLESLVLDGRHFPLSVESSVLGPSTVRKINPIPCHPSIFSGGIPLELLFSDFEKNKLSFLDEAIEYTIQDVEALRERKVPFSEDTLAILKGYKKNDKAIKWDGKKGVIVSPFPFMSRVDVNNGSLYIGRRRIHSNGIVHSDLLPGNEGLVIPEIGLQDYLSLPKGRVFSDAILREYGFEVEYTENSHVGVRGGYWCKIEVTDSTPAIKSILYKNLMLAINNAVVRNKYSQQI